MAKRRRGAALFEVIHADSRFPSRHSSSTGGSRWWFRRRRRSADEMAAFVPSATAAEVAPSIPAGPGLGERLAALIPPLPSMPRFGMTVDSDQQVLRFQLSYSGAVVATGAMVVALLLAYVVGRHGAHHAMPALAEQTTGQLRAGPVNPEVLDVRTPTEIAVTRTETPVTDAPRTTSTAIVSAGVVAPAHNEPAAPTTFVANDGKRQIGLHYVIVQTYPTEEQGLAESAVKLLNANGVPCSIETGVAYAPRWLTVVGTTGFDRVRNSPEYDRYVARIEQISANFAGTSKFKRFEPKPYKWREPAKTGQ